MVSALDLALPQDLAGAFAGPPTRSPGQQSKPRQRQEQQPKQSVEEKLERTLDPGPVPPGALPTSEPLPNPGTLLFSNENLQRFAGKDRPMNVLPFDKQVAIISALIEGCSIRSTERLTGVHRDTIMFTPRVRNSLPVDKFIAVLLEIITHGPVNNYRTDSIQMGGSQSVPWR